MQYLELLSCGSGCWVNSGIKIMFHKGSERRSHPVPEKGAFILSFVLLDDCTLDMGSNCFAQHGSNQNLTNECVVPM